MKKIMVSKAKFAEYVKRLVVYIAGMFLIAAGVTLSRSTDLGVSPVNSIPNVLSLRFERISMGTWVIIVFAFFILVQAALLLKKFKWFAFLQLISSTLFGYLVDFTNYLGSLVLPVQQSVALKCVFIAVSVVVIAFGIFMYLEAKILSMPGEGVTLALSERTKLKVSTCKIIFDVSVVSVATILSFVFFKKLHGVGVGTVVIAVLVGFAMKPIMHYLKKPLNVFMFGKPQETERTESAAESTAENSAVAAVNAIYREDCASEYLLENTEEKAEGVSEKSGKDESVSDGVSFSQRAVSESYEET